MVCSNTPQDIRDAARRGDATITARVPVTNSNPGGVAKGGTNATADPEEAVHGIFSRLFDGDSSFKSPNNDNGTHPFDQGIETHPFRAGSNSVCLSPFLQVSLLIVFPEDKFPYLPPRVSRNTSCILPCALCCCCAHKLDVIRLFPYVHGLEALWCCTGCSNVMKLHTSSYTL